MEGERDKEVDEIALRLINYVREGTTRGNRRLLKPSVTAIIVENKGIFDMLTAVEKLEVIETFYQYEYSIGNLNRTYTLLKTQTRDISKHFMHLNMYFDFVGTFFVQYSLALQLLCSFESGLCGYGEQNTSNGFEKRVGDKRAKKHTEFGEKVGELYYDLEELNEPLDSIIKVLNVGEVVPSGSNGFNRLVNFTKHRGVLDAVVHKRLSTLSYLQAKEAIDNIRGNRNYFKRVDNLIKEVGIRRVVELERTGKMPFEKEYKGRWEELAKYEKHLRSEFNDLIGRFDKAVEFMCDVLNKLNRNYVQEEEDWVSRVYSELGVACEGEHNHTRE